MFKSTSEQPPAPPPTKPSRNSNQLQPPTTPLTDTGAPDDVDVDDVVIRKNSTASDSGESGGDRKSATRPPTPTIAVDNSSKKENRNSTTKTPTEAKSAPNTTTTAATDSPVLERKNSVSSSGALDPLLYKAFHLTDELSIACFQYGRLMKTKFLVTQRHICTSHKIRKQKNFLLPYERLKQLDADHNSLTLKLIYLGSGDQAAPEDEERLMKFTSLTSLKSIVSLVRQLHRIRQSQSFMVSNSSLLSLGVSHVDKELVINIEKTSKERKEEAAASATSDANANSKNSSTAKDKKTSAISEKAKALDINFGGGGPTKMGANKASKPLGVVLKLNDSTFVDRELSFGVSDVVIKKPSVSGGDAKNKPKSDKSEIVIAYDKLTALTVQSRTNFLTIDYEKKNKVEFLANDFIDVCKQFLQRCGERLKMQFENHVDTWADPVELEKECRSSASNNKKPMIGFGPNPNAPKPKPKVEAVEEPPSNVLKTTVVDLNEMDDSGRLTMAKKTSGPKRNGKRPPAKKNIDIPPTASSADSINV